VGSGADALTSISVVAHLEERKGKMHAASPEAEWSGEADAFPICFSQLRQPKLSSKFAPLPAVRPAERNGRVRRTSPPHFGRSDGATADSAFLVSARLIRMWSNPIAEGESAESAVPTKVREPVVTTRLSRE
jgi:hypothetical protein